MSFNMRRQNGPERNPLNNWNKRRQLVKDCIKKYQPDIIGSQELFPYQVNELQKILPGYKHFGVGRRADLNGESMTIFYRRSKLKHFGFLKLQKYQVAAAGEKAGFAA